jgi:hypothetical protein
MKHNTGQETGMDSEAIRTPNSTRLKNDLSHDAVDLALKGEWERATEVNKAILELFPDDVEAMNRLVKALIELGNYLDARAVLNQVCEVAPYNTIAKKNRARLDQLTSNPDAAGVGQVKQSKKTAGAPQIFIEESGKSGTTVLRNTKGNKAVFRLSTSEQVVLSRDKNSVIVLTLEGQLIGQLEPKLGSRLARLIDGGNKYAAVVSLVNGDEVSVIIKETFKHRSLQNVSSFLSKAKQENPVLLNETVARFMREEEQADDDDEEEYVIDEEEIETGWSADDE